jgi:hypothetical protein
MKGAILGVVTFCVIAAFFATGLIVGKGLKVADQVGEVAAAVQTIIQVATPTPVIVSRQAIVEQIQQIERLETTTYTIERVIEAKQSDRYLPDWLRGDRILLVARGTVVAGVDLAKISSDDVLVAADGKSAVVTMPPVAILNQDMIINNVMTRVYDRQRGILAPLNQNLESDARRQADEQILLAACSDGILQQATTDAQRALRQILMLMPVEVTVKTSAVPQCPVGAS